MLNFKKITRQSLALLGMVGVLAFAAGNASAAEPVVGGRAVVAHRHVQHVHRHAHRAQVRHARHVLRHHRAHVHAAHAR